MKAESAVSTAAYIVAGVLIAYSINLGMSFMLSTTMPVVAVESNSMVPAFYRGDILILRGENASLLKVGDVIVYSPEGQSVPIVHRIISINQDGSFQTKGDANAGQLSFEKHISPSEIHGVVIFIIPYVGWIKIAVTSYVIPNIFWIIIALLIAFAAFKASKYIKSTYKIK
jgi:signal peptidase I